MYKMYTTESLCCTPASNTTLMINYTSVERKREKEGRKGGRARQIPGELARPSYHIRTQGKEDRSSTSTWVPHRPVNMLVL